MTFELKVSRTYLGRNAFAKDAVVDNLFSADSHSMVGKVHRTFDVENRGKYTFFMKFAVTQPAGQVAVPYLWARDKCRGALIAGSENSNLQPCR